MKQIIQQLKASSFKPYTLSIGIFAFSAAVIWFLGPFVHINNFYPLDAADKRLYVIATVFLIWMLKLIFFTNTSKKTMVMRSRHPEFTKKLKILQGRVEGAIEFLRKTEILKQSRQTSLYNLPWYLIIGPDHAGKTSLLANAQINYILAKQFKGEHGLNLAPSETCDFWVTREAVFIDVPSSYITSTGIARRLSVYNVLWRNLLNFIKTYRGEDSLHGVILTLPLAELMGANNQTRRDKIIQDLKIAIEQTKEMTQKNIGCYFAITKCDLLPGFVEFFSDSSAEELNQAWGITFNKALPAAELLDTFNTRFSALIKRLNKQLIWRLHQERNPFVRPFIKDFPLQIERIKDCLTEIIKSLSEEMEFDLHGIYLTSSLQPSVDPIIHQHSAPSTTQALQISQSPQHATRPFFVKQFLTAGIAPMHVATLPQKKKTWANSPLTTYGLTASILILGLGIFGEDFHQSLAQSYAIKDGIAQYQLARNDHQPLDTQLTKATPLLDALHDAATHKSKSLLVFSDKAQVTADAAYASALQTIVLPAIQTEFESYLQTVSNKSPAEVYDVLKAYLMLGDDQHLEINHLQKMLSTISASHLSKENIITLQHYLNEALAHKLQPITLKNELIGEVRSALISLSPIQLSYLILKANTNTNDKQSLQLNLNLNSELFNVSDKSLAVPQMFTAESFRKINSEISQAMQEAQAGNWILGEINSSSTISSDELRNLYLASYVSTWENILNTLTLKSPKDLHEANEMLTKLTSDNSPLLSFFQMVKQNTNFASVLSASPRLAQVNSLLLNNAQHNSSLYKIFISLRNLNNYIQNIIGAEDNAKAALQAASIRMSNPTAHDAIASVFAEAKGTPEPLRSWLNGLASQSWHFILADATKSAAQQWQNEVSTSFNKIADRFPVSPKAQDEIKIEDFTKLYGHQGIFPSFFRDNLQAFIDTSGKKWQWKKLDNAGLALSDNALAQIQNALQMQQAFFPNNDNHVSVQFALQPLALTQDLKNFSLMINGQNVQYNHLSMAIPQTMTWPGNLEDYPAGVNLQTADNKNFKNILHGSWSLFKIIAASDQKLITPQEMLVDVELKGHKAQYLLFSQTQINPFLPTNLERLKLPENLV